MHRATSLLLLLLTGPLLADAPDVDVPRLDAITIDGDATDWGERGYRVDVMEMTKGLSPAADFDATYRVGWDDRGLFVLLVVRDDKPIEAPLPHEIWSKDSIVVALTPKDAKRPGWSVTMSPGVDAQAAGVRMYADGKSAVGVAKSKTSDGGYTLELLVPWSALGGDAKAGEQFTLTITLHDIDDPSQTSWTSGWQAKRAQTVRLGKDPSPPARAYAGGAYEELKRTRINVYGAASLVGSNVGVRREKDELARAALKDDGGRAVARFELPMPPAGETWPVLTASIDDQPPLSIALPDATELRGQEFAGAGIKFSPSYVFSGTKFPAADFDRPERVESLIGPYTIKSTYYDRDGHAVTEAKEPGRYAAVIEITPKRGRVTKRFRTIFRRPDGRAGDAMWLDTAFTFPQGSPVSAPAGSIAADLLNEHVHWEMRESIDSDNGLAPLLAWMYELAKSGADPMTADPRAAERQWWVDFKRKHYGLGPAEPFVCPRPVDGSPAPVLRDGSASDAGMTDGAAGAIDAVLQKWSTDTDEPFSVCVARRGVVVLHKAYGQRRGKALTVDDRLWHASITKLMSATLMLMLADQGLVDLDAPVAHYLPAWRDIPVERPITIRNIYTHTGGLFNGPGDWRHDLEECIGDVYTHLRADKMSFYNGTGNALGSKVIETITGEALPQFYRKHLLDPLGCTNTRVYGSSGDAHGTPMDLARIGQMLLNGGAYGDKRFLRKSTLDGMLPAPMTKQFGPSTTVVKGFGCQLLSGTPLGKRTINHGAASSATFAVDLDNELVVVMCRDRAGTNFEMYHPQFLKAIVDNLANGK